MRTTVMSDTRAPSGGVRGGTDVPGDAIGRARRASPRFVRPAAGSVVPRPPAGQLDDVGADREQGVAVAAPQAVELAACAQHVARAWAHLRRLVLRGDREQRTDQ